MFLNSKLEEEALMNLEFKAAQRMNELIELRNKEERERKIRLNVQQRNRELMMMDHAVEERWRSEQEELRLKRQLLRQQKLMSLNVEAEENQK